MLITQCKLIKHEDWSKHSVRWVKSKNLAYGAAVLINGEFWIVEEMYATMQSHEVHDSHKTKPPSNKIEGCF